MELKIITLAEFATISRDNRLVIAGTIEQVSFERLKGASLEEVGAIPVGKIYLVATTQASIADGLAHTAGLRVVDDDERMVWEAPDMTPFHFVANPHGWLMNHNHVIQLAGLAVPRPGDYAIEYLVDGKSLGRVALHVVDVTVSGMAGA